MTLNSTTSRVSYAGDGATVSFAVTFVFWDLDDPQLVLRDSNGAETTWTRGTQYTLTGGSGATGTITVVTSPTDYTPASGETLIVRSNLAHTQPSKIPAGGSLPSGTVEQQLDQIVRQVQQLSEEVGRAFKLKVTSAESGITLDDLSGNTAKFAQVNAAEDGLTFATATSAGTLTDPVPVANGGTGSTTAAAALTALAAAGTGISNTFTKTQISTKGADLASANPLVIGTDGQYWDVTGTTGFSSMTVTAGTLFMLQFDSALLMTDGATLDLGGSNITTATGDRAIFFATAANTVQMMSYQQEGSRAHIGRKGADLASASPLVIGTDGNYFDVTGTTGFSAMTVTAGTLFMLQFDGILTMTDGASLDLAGQDITTAAGDRGLFYATAANTVQMLIFQQEGGRTPKPDYESAETALDNDAQITFAHGLTTAPSKVEVVLRANTATAQGWADNEEMIFAFPYQGALADDGADCTADATNVYITQGANIQLLDHASFNHETITQTEYDWVVRAWK